MAMRRVGIRAGVLAVAVLFFLPALSRGASSQTDSAAAKREAESAGKAWLALVDESRYAESWTRAAALFRGKVSKEQWISLVGGVRGGLGKLKQRELETATYAEAEAGTMVVLLFKSAFDTLPLATEQVTILLDGGSWRCAGYFVRPRK